MPSSEPPRPSRRRFLAAFAAAGVGLPHLPGLPYDGLPSDPDDLLHGFPSVPGEAALGPVCVFSKHLQFLDYDAMAEAAAEAGFDGVDLTVRPGGHVVPERVEADLPRAVAAVRRAGLRAPMMTTALRDPADPRTAAVLETAGGLGIAAYRMDWLDYDDARPVGEQLRAYRPVFRDLAALNERFGLHGAYQNHAGRHVGSPVWDLAVVLDDLDPRWIGVQYDIRHATVEGANAWPLGLKLLHPYVRTVVVKDFVWAQRDGRWQVVDVPLGEGMVDFAAYFALARALGIRASVSMHFEYALPEDRAGVVAAMRRDLGRLRTLLADAGL